MLVQIDCSVTAVKRAGCIIADIDADAPRIMLEKPRGQQSEQLRRDVIAALIRDDVNPLQLSLTVEAASEMARHVTNR